MAYGPSRVTVTRFGYTNCFILPPAEHCQQRGGFWILWNRAHTDVVLQEVGERLVHFRMVISDPGTDGREQQVNLTALYNYPQPSLQHIVWDQLVDISSNIRGPWLVLGDFNAILHPSEKWGGKKPSWARLSVFQNVLAQCQVMDLGFCGSTFTWDNKDYGPRFIRERLDRACGNHEWVRKYPLTSVQHIVNSVSDHKLLLLDTKGNFKAPPKRFRYENGWTELGHFRTQLKKGWDHWNGMNKSFVDCCQSLAREAPSWKLLHLKEVNGRMADNRSRLNFLDSIVHTDPVRFGREIEALNAEMVKLQKQKTMYWAQRSRLKWIQSGDANTKFFHAVASHRARRNFVHGVKNELGDWVTDQDSISQVFFDFFSKQAQSTNPSIHDFLSLNTPTLTATQQLDLVRPVTNDEIWAAVQCIGPDKAPGPDGLNAHFYQHHWDIVGPKVCDFVNQFFVTGLLPAEINATQIVLIPKVANPQLPAQYRPISLCNVSYKIITKMLVNRIRLSLPTLISPFQNAFVPGRHIGDNIMLAHELLHTMASKRKSKQYFCALKLDIEKAYDRLEWGFIEWALQCFHFPPPLISWINTCIRTCTFHVKVNQSMSKEWRSSRGIRQGDPLSPYLFILCQELFVHLLHRFIDLKRIEPLQVCRQGPKIPILCFADDCMVFLKTNNRSISGFQECLNMYAKASGQAVCWHKSRVLFSPNTPIHTKQHITHRLGVQRNKRKDKYLGLPFLMGRKKADLFDHIVERVQGRVHAWYNRFLAMAGRAVLIQTVSSTIPSYAMSITVVPQGSLDRIDKLNKAFLWNPERHGKRRSRVRWDIVCRPKHCGGLGIRNLRVLNEAYQFKLIWNLLQHPENLWAIVYKQKYFPTIPFWQASSKAHHSWFWKLFIRHRAKFKNLLGWRIGDGKDISFWFDRWCHTKRLVDYVPPSTLCDPNLTVQELIVDGHWDYSSLINILPPELVHEIMAVPLPALVHNKDTVVWPWARDGLFSVKSAYNVLRNQQCTHPTWNWSRIWALKLWPRIKLFLWQMIHHSLPTALWLASRKIIASQECPLCHVDAESIDHVFLKCHVFASLRDWCWSSRLCDLARNSTCVAIVFDDVLDLQHIACFVILCWLIWDTRNRVLFRDETINLLDVKKRFHKVLAENALLNKGLSKARSQIVLSWSPPPDHFIMLNTDGSALGNPGLSGMGCVLRDQQGRFVRAACGFLGICTNNLAELEAVRLGLLMALQLRVTKLQICTDSMYVLAILRREVAVVWLHHQVVLELRHLLSQFEAWEVKFVYRKLNVVADRLAREGRDMSLFPTGTPTSLSVNSPCQVRVFDVCPQCVVSSKKKSLAVIFIHSVSATSLLSILQSTTISVADFNATATGDQYDTVAIQSAINYCSSLASFHKLPCQVLFPPGNYLTATLFLKSGVTLNISDGAKILGGTRIEDYPPERERWYVIVAEDETDVGITGGGEVNGQGFGFVKRFDERKNVMLSWNQTGQCLGDECRPRLIGFIGCRNVRVWDVKFDQPAYWCLHIVRCQNTSIHDVSIHGDFNTPNNDGIDIEDSNNTLITRCIIDTGDDAICPKTYTSPLYYLTATNCWIRTKSSAIKLGSASWYLMKGLVFDNITIAESHRGLGLQIRDGGNVSDITFSNINITTRYYDPSWWGRAEPIYVTTCPRDQNAKAGSISNLKFINITATSENGVFLSGSKGGLLSDISFINVNLTYKRWTNYIDGLVDYRPGCQGLVNRSSAGIMMEHIDGLSFENLSMVWAEERTGKWNNPPEFRPATVNNVSLLNFRSGMYKQ